VNKTKFCQHHLFTSEVLEASIVANMLRFKKGGKCA